MPKRKLEEETLGEEKVEVKAHILKEMKLVSKSIVKNLNYWVGAHVSASGGPQNAITNTHKIGGQAFALFLKNQRRWESPQISSKSIEQFKKLIEDDTHFNNMTNKILPHGSYMINLANPSKEARDKSYGAFLDDLKRCELLGINLYNFHPGSCVGKCSRDESIQHIADCINKAQEETSNVVILIENMSGQQNIIGSKFEELAKIIDKVKNKSRVGVCFDTCHAFAAGYDLRIKDKFNDVFQKFDSIIGLKYLRAFHLNDSKGELGCAKDRHENIGKGKLGIECFRLIMNDQRFQHMPLVLETPIQNDNDDIYKHEIELLYSLCE